MTGTEAVEDRAKYLRFCRLRGVELAIIKVLWERGVPLTAREVFEELHRRGRWSYLTVRTTLTRMVEGDVLEQQRRGRSNFFEPTVDRHAVAAACVEEVIGQVLGGDLCHGLVSVLRHLPLSRDALRVVRRTVSQALEPAEVTSAASVAPPGLGDSVVDRPMPSLLVP
jgi:predicted transcriptional regulator